MQLETKDGISCDICTMQYKLDFTYYSFDFKKLPNSKQYPPLNQILNFKNSASIDVCAICFNSIKSRILNNYNPIKHMTYCEYTGNQLVDPYYCVVTMVTVTNNQKKMRSVIDPRHLEFIISSSSYTILTTRQNQSQWTTNS